MKNNLKAFLFLTPLILMLVVFVIIPFITGAIESFKVTNVFDRINFQIGLRNFQQVAASSEFNSAFFYSNMIFFIGVPIGLILSVGFALLLNSILNKFFRNVVITILFSQFFISAFAIGLAFIYLFDSEKAAFNLIFNSQFNFNSGINNLIPLIVFHIWRIWPFNTVMLLFHFTNQKKKYLNIMQIDNLTFKDKLFNVYFQNIKRLMFIIIYINVLEALLLNPLAIYKQSVLSVNNVSTFSYYIYFFLKISNEPLFGVVGAASIIILSYLIAVTLIFISIYLFITKFTKIKNYFINQNWKNKFIRIRF